ncbi:hypothetical protein Pmani_030028 [Petrolisthes manimaculis]|uniref:Septin n=1 Tax=Petrolisthes manimaculis TaxID=1843537 RepID=A0AAE1TWE9_9EUCA|nr:hypothetical protein Pmani_030028 [Petrolisthes manimaculis]
MPQAGPGSTPTEGSTYVGIDTLQEQTRLRALRRGYSFNLMVIGRSGLGKSTLVNTLFKSTTVSRRKVGNVDPLPTTTQVRHTSTALTEGGVHLDLTITDTPGFGDHVNNENCWDPIVTYIEKQYERYLEEEQKVDRLLPIPDTRIHCCLYFISPTGHSLSSLDVEVLSRLDKITNVIPVIAKADTLTVEERSAFKERIRADLTDHGINIYPPTSPTTNTTTNTTTTTTNTSSTTTNDHNTTTTTTTSPKTTTTNINDLDSNTKIRERVPFGVVGSCVWHEVHGGRAVLGRRCSWGMVEVENKNHNDFAYLRDMLIRTHMQDLIDSTSERHYENFRRVRLAKTATATTTTTTTTKIMNGGQNFDNGEKLK